MKGPCIMSTRLLLASLLALRRQRVGAQPPVVPDGPKPPPIDVAVIEFELPPGTTATVNGEEVGTKKRLEIGGLEPGQSVKRKVVWKMPNREPVAEDLLLKGGWRVRLAVPPSGADGPEPVPQDCHGQVTRLVFSPDGRHLLATTSHHASLWEVATGRTVWRLRGATGRAFTEDGHGLIAATDEALHVFDPTHWQTVTTVKKGRLDPQRMTVSGNGQVVASYNFARVGSPFELFNQSGAEHWGGVNLYSREVSEYVLSHDGQRFAAIDKKQKKLVVHDTKTGDQLFAANLPDLSGERLGFSPDGDWLAVNKGGRRITLWDARKWTERHTLELTAGPTFVMPWRLVATASGWSPAEASRPTTMK